MTGTVSRELAKLFDLCTDRNFYIFLTKLSGYFGINFVIVLLGLFDHVQRFSLFSKCQHINNKSVCLKFFGK